MQFGRLGRSLIGRTHTFQRTRVWFSSKVSNSEITESIKNARSEKRLIDFFVENRSSFNTINYLALLKQAGMVSGPQGGSKPYQGASINSEGYKHVLAGIQEILENTQSQAEPRVVANAYFYLWKLKQTFVKQSLQREYFQLLGLIESIADSMIDKFNEQELGNLIYVVVRKGKVPILEGRLGLFIQSRIEEYSEVFLITTLNTLVLNKETHKRVIDTILRRFRLKPDEELATLSQIDYFTLLLNLAKLDRSRADRKPLLERLIPLAPKYLDQAEDKAIGSLCHTLSLLEKDEYPDELIVRIGEIFLRNSESFNTNKKVMLLLFMLLNEKQMQDDKILSQIYFGLADRSHEISIEDLYTILYYFQPISNEKVNLLVRQLIESRVETLLTKMMQPLGSELFSRLSLGLKRYIKTQTLSNKTILSILEMYDWEIHYSSKGESKEKFYHHLVILSSISSFCDKDSEISQLVQRIANKSMYLYTQDIFMNDAQLRSADANKRFIDHMCLIIPITKERGHGLPFCEAILLRLDSILADRMEKKIWDIDDAVMQILQFIIQNQEMVMRRPQMITSVASKLDSMSKVSVATRNNPKYLDFMKLFKPDSPDTLDESISL
jgi:hypothetical protein